MVARYIVVDKTKADAIVAANAKLGVLTNTEFGLVENPNGGGAIMHIAGTEEQLAQVRKIDGVGMMTDQLC
jgi:hypothetical protein